MEIINIIAVVIGPLFAVGITLWWQERKERRDAKIRLFSTLMAFRKSYPVSYEWANSLNLIDVVFADSPTVVDHWHQYYEMLQHTQNPNIEARNHKYLELMSVMAAALGYRRLQQTDIDKFYTPQAHGDQAHLNWQCQTEWLRFLQNANKSNSDPKPTVQ